MAIISEEKIAEIRKSVDIVDFIQDYVPLKSSGKNFFGVCPFHDDHSPSMSVSRDKQIYKCFVCGASGNIFNFIMDYEDKTFLEALEVVANKAGIPLNINVKKETANSNKTLKMYELTNKIYVNNLKTKYGLGAMEYLKNRNITDEIIKHFKIGLSIKNNHLISNVLSESYTKAEILESGLCNDNNDLHDMFFNRIMFPLYDLNGNIVAYSGRVFNGEDNFKYVNTRETKLFKKGELLYNYHNAKKYRKEGIIVVEGFMDVIALHKIGIFNVVATMGTAVTKNQINLLAKLSKEITLCFDGDQAGKKATDVAIEMLDLINIKPKVVRLDDLDPDEYINKYGKEKILDKFKNSISSLEFKMDGLKDNFNLNDNSDYAKYINLSLIEMSKFSDDILLELTLNKLSKESGISIVILKQKLEGLINSKNSKQVNEDDIKEIEIKEETGPMAERELLYYMLNNSEVITIFKNQNVFLPTKKYRTLANELVELKGNDIADILTSFRDTIHKDTISCLLDLKLPDEYTTDRILDNIYLIKIFNINFEIKKKKELQRKENDLEKQQLYGMQITELKKKEQELRRQLC